MRRLRNLAELVSGNLSRQVGLVLMLTAALAGSFLLIEFLVSLLSSGPQDILAVAPAQEATFGLPNGVGLLEVGVLVLSLAVALAVLIASVKWPLTRASFRPSLSLVLSILFALTITGIGVYIAFSGLIGQGIDYSEHTVDRSILKPVGLAVLALISLTLIVAGFINRYVLGLLIAAWLSAAAIFGFLDARPLDGLDLFTRPATLETPSAYTELVEGHRQEDASPIEVEVPQEQGDSSTETGVPPRQDVPTYIVSVTTEQSEPPAPEPLFWVSGADHTTYLRTATGDVYQQGMWQQLDPLHLLVEDGSSIPEKVVAAIEEARGEPAGSWPPERLDASLLASPAVEPVESVWDVIAVTAYYEGATFNEGLVPSVDHLVGVNTAAAYYPFSATLQLEGPVHAYQLGMSIPHFDPDDVFGAAPARDPSYLQLPEDLPARVLELAEQFKGNESPYVRANHIHRYLRERFVFLTTEPEGSMERPVDHDPVDWFLFERRAGDAGNFSSAFVILARAAEIPARVVSGWAIKRDEGNQVVNADQAHQWAEIALDGVGWITFDPTRHDAFPPRGEDQSLLSLIEELINSEDPGIREDAAHALGDLGDPEALPALLDAALNDESVAVRLAAETAIIKIGIEELIRVLLNHDDPVARRNAAELLGAYASSNIFGDEGRSKAVDALLQALSSDADARVRTASISGLEKIGGEAAETGVLQASVADEEVSVREAAIRALGNMKARWTAEEMVTLLREDANAVIREAAAWTLGELKEAVALQPLIDARDDRVEAVREAAAEALRKWLIPDLTTVLLESDDMVQRAAAAKVLGETGDIAAVPALNWGLNDPAISVRAAALDALSAMGEITILENGSGLLTADRGRALVSGTTTLAHPEPPATPIFAVEGASHTGYLRTGVGDIYAEGQWLAEKQTGFAYESLSDISDASMRPTVEAAETHKQEITVSGLDSTQLVPAGIVPTSKRLERVGIDGMFWQPSATFSNPSFRNSYSWSSIVDNYSDAQLNAAERATGLVNSPYTSLPEWAQRGRIYDLAVEIIAGHSTPYSQAKAIEQYLRTEYAYQPPETSRDWAPPEGQDPVDWFLFDKREGASGNFSSAFVFLARAVGLPARVVSGWVIGITPNRQIVSSDQAHQWAEVAFEGLGWVDFDSTPGGPRARAALETLAGGDPDAAADALKALEEAGEDVTGLENGCGLVRKDGKGYCSAGTTTGQSAGLPETPLFQITGAANTGYLRTSVGDVYENGRWQQLDPVSIDASSGVSISGATWTQLGLPDSEFGGLPPARRSDASLFGFRQIGHTVRTDNIQMTPIESAEHLPIGPVPISLDLQSVGMQGVYYPFSSTFRLPVQASAHTWTSRIVSFQAQDLEQAGAADDRTYLQLPSDLPPRIQELAQQVTSGYTSPYGKAKALEAYLKTEYTYRFADSPNDAPPPGRDPVDWFLFDHHEGTCGNFSSAFVVMARSVGIPARVVSGWAISQTADTQIVRADQAHQWAEVALEEIGWVTFEPTPPEGPPSRAEEGTEGAQDGSDSGELAGALEALAEGDPEAISEALEALTEEGSEELAGALEALAGGDPEATSDALEALEEAGVDVVRLENGGVMLEKGGKRYSIPGTTTSQSPGLLETPLFTITGAANTGYLRTAVGDLYLGGGWRQLDPVSVDVSPHASVSADTWAQYGRPDTEFGKLPLSRRGDASLFGFRQNEYIVQIDNIEMKPAGQTANLPIGPVPVSLDLQSVGMRGVYYPFSSTFRLPEQATTHSWTSRIASFQAQDLEQARAAGDSTYLQLLPDMPPRIQELAQRITSGYTSPYAKAKALEAYLKTRYTYRLADSPNDAPPPGRDPVDWFLFDHREGTCGVFSSAFVVMARSVGIPARVVSGWAISRTAGTQIVLANQAHQWAEVALEGIGWVTFEPTASGGAPSRVDGGGGSGSGGFGFGSGEPVVELPPDTVITITESPAEARWEEPLIVAGAVGTVSGSPVSDMIVEVYANKAKEHGGRLIGIAVSDSGSWSAVVRMPRDMELGIYQLFARAVGNSRYNESWSDPGREMKLGQDTVTTITQSPTEVRRERPLTVAGTVETVSGSPVSDMRVEVYVNETKEHGGRLIGTTVTRSGRWSAVVRIPGDMELGAYQLLARAVENDHYYESWSDPDITVYSGSGLELTGPTLVPVDDEAAFEGRLSDDRGMGLENREMVVSVDGIVTDSIMTNPQGTFAFRLTFSEPGRHWVNVEVAETDFVLGNSVRIGVDATLPTNINLEAPVSVGNGEEFRITGTLLSVRGEALANRPVVVSIGEDIERHRSTDDNGEFEVEGSLSTPGVYTVRAEFERDGWVLDSTATARLLVRERALLTLEGPSTIELGSGGMFTGLLTTAAGAPIHQSALNIVDASDAKLGTVITDDDGRFEYQHSSFLRTGPQSLTARYRGAELITPSSARIAFSVLAQTSISLELPTIVKDTDSFTLQGSLRDINGDPVPDVEVEVAGRGAQTLVTDADGKFSWEAVATFDEGVAESAHESHLSVEVFFSGTDHLAPAAAAAEVAVGLPRILFEPLEPVARGDAVTLRGTVLLGNRPMAGVDLDVVGQGSVQSGIAGEFVFLYHVAGDLPLGTSDVTVTAPNLNASASVPIEVRSAVSIVVTPVEDVRPGEMTLLQATLRDDRLAPISEATLRSDGGVDVVTDDLGVALLELAVPDDEDASTFFITITFDGDDQHMPLTYFTGVPLSPPAGLNWFLWAGAASGVVTLVAAVYAGRKVRYVPLPALLRRRRVTASPEAESAYTPDAETLTEEEPTETGRRRSLWKWGSIRRRICLTSGAWVRRSLSP